MQWSDGDVGDGSNIAGALRIAAQGGYDAVIIVTDGLANSSAGSDYQLFTTDRDLLNVTQQVSALKSSGTAVFGLGITGGKEVAVINLENKPSYTPTPNWWYADSDPIPSYLRKSTQGEKLQQNIDRSGGYLDSWKWYNAGGRRLQSIGIGTQIKVGPNGREVYRSDGLGGAYMGPLYTM